MSRHSKCHEELDASGVGRCGVPMWMDGLPAGFCDEPAYGNQEAGQTRYGEWQRGRFLPGYSSALTCYNHGGPKQ